MSQLLSILERLVAEDPENEERKAVARKLSIRITEQDTQDVWQQLFVLMGESKLSEANSHSRVAEVRRSIIWEMGEVPMEEDRIGWPRKVAKCKTPADFLLFFSLIGIPGDCWKNSGWLQTKGMLSREQGGAGRPLGSLYQAITRDPRFQSYRKFVAWMEAERLRVSIKQLLYPKQTFLYLQQSPLLKRILDYFDAGPTV